MEEEIFGPVLTIYVYPEAEYEETLRLCDATSPYGLTGAIFAQDRLAVQKASEVLRHAAGNFYINDKPTGAVVGLQPFGGSRASGTNDKAGSPLNLQRWVYAANHQGDLLPANRLSLPVHGVIMERLPATPPPYEEDDNDDQTQEEYALQPRGEEHEQGAVFGGHFA